MNIASELLKPNVTQTFLLLYFTSKKQNTIHRKLEGLHTRINSGLSAVFAIFCHDLFASPVLLAREIFTRFHFGYSRPLDYRKQVRRQVDFTVTIKCEMKIGPGVERRTARNLVDI